MTRASKARFALFALVCEARPAADKIKSLPNWNAALPSAMYSGFVNSTHTASYGQLHSHYWFVEAEVPKPETAPLLVWYNGGPGASSLFGLMIELGPFLFNDDSLATDDFKKSGIPSPLLNPYSWSKVRAPNVRKALTCRGASPLTSPPHPTLPFLFPPVRSLTSSPYQHRRPSASRGATPADQVATASPAVTGMTREPQLLTMHLSAAGRAPSPPSRTPPCS